MSVLEVNVEFKAAIAVVVVVWLGWILLLQYSNAFLAFQLVLPKIKQEPPRGKSFH